MNILKKFIFFFSFIAFYFIAKEFLNLYVSLKEIDPTLSIVFLILVVISLMYFVVNPILQIIRLPRYPGPASNRLKEKLLIRNRIKIFRKNQALEKFSIDISESEYTRQKYDEIIERISQESKKIREDQIKKIFLATAIAQNGFIDGMILLSSCVNLVKKTFILYGGRVSYKDLLAITRAAYYSVIISASEGVETGIEELIEKVGPNSIKSIPFAGKILESFADGFISASLLCRVGLITENYCKKTYIEKDKELYPGVQTVLQSVGPIAKSVKETIYDKFKAALKEKTIDKLGSVAKDISASLHKSIRSVNPSDGVKFLEKEAERSLALLKKISGKFKFLKFRKNKNGGLVE